MGPRLEPVDARDFRRTDLPFAVKTVKVPTRAEEVSSLVRKVSAFCQFLGLRRVIGR